MKTFLGVLTMQVGVLVLSTSFITNAVCTIVTNVLSVDWQTIIAWGIVLFFSISLIVTWSLAFFGAFAESYTVLKNAQLLWTVLICIWIGLIVCSLFPSCYKNICLESRCPESMWLVSNLRPFNELLFRTNDTARLNSVIEFDLTSESNPTTTEKSPVSLKTNLNQQFDPMEDRPESRNEIFAIVVSLIVLILYAVVYIYSWIFLLSYTWCIRNKNITQSSK